MGTIKVAANFTLDEFLDKATYEGLLRMANIAQYIRDTTGLAVTVNNWHTGGQYNYSGFRPPACTVGSPTSEHRDMNASDFKIGTWTGPEMFAWGEQHASELYALGARRFEDCSITPTWFHVDGREHGEQCIKVIDKKTVTRKIPIHKPHL